MLERATGIEPVSSAWKAEVLPLHNARATEFGHKSSSNRRQGSECYDFSESHDLSISYR